MREELLGDLRALLASDDPRLQSAEVQTILRAIIGELDEPRGGDDPATSQLETARAADLLEQLFQDRAIEVAKHIEIRSKSTFARTVTRLLEMRKRVMERMEDTSSLDPMP